MEIIILYIILIYLIGFGMIINQHSLVKEIKKKLDKMDWILFWLSPISIPVMLGMWFHECTSTTEATAPYKK